MGEWQLALAVIGSVVATLGLARVAANDLLMHIKSEFAQAEARHLEASAIWKERLEVRDEKIMQLGKAVETVLAAHNVCEYRTTAASTLLARSMAAMDAKYETRENAQKERELIYQEIHRLSSNIAALAH